MLALAQSSPITLLSVLPTLATSSINAPAVVEGIGVIVTGGAECPLAMFEDGSFYALSGSAVINSRLKPGTWVRIKGTPIRISTCMQAQTLKVIDLKVIDLPIPELPKPDIKSKE